MSKLKGLVAALVVAAAAGAVAVAYGTTSAASGAASSGEHFPPSAEVRAMLAQVSPGQLSTYDHALVAFKNRNTLSAQNDPNRGIGAARDYIFGQFKRIAATSDGRMTVRLQSFVQPKVAGELPRAVRITNVIATLRGSQAASVHRIYVVSGHYDSRCTDELRHEVPRARR